MYINQLSMLSTNEDTLTYVHVAIKFSGATYKHTNYKNVSILTSRRKLSTEREPDRFPHESYHLSCFGRRYSYHSSNNT